MKLIRFKRKHGWMAALLPILLLRLLIPVGFMPMVGSDHRVHLVICEGYAPLPASMMDMPMDEGMDMSQPLANDGAGGKTPAHQDHGDCPFGSSPVLGALSVVNLSAALLHRPAPPINVTAQVAFFQVLARAQFPRGPPA